MVGSHHQLDGQERHVESWQGTVVIWLALGSVVSCRVPRVWVLCACGEDTEHQASIHLSAPGCGCGQMFQVLALTSPQQRAGIGSQISPDSPCLYFSTATVMKQHRMGHARKEPGGFLWRDAQGVGCEV